MVVVYFTSATKNTKAFVDKLNMDSFKIHKELVMQMPFVLCVPTYSDQFGNGAVPKPIIHFLNNKTNRDLLVGVIGFGNRNFNDTFCLGARIVAQKTNTKILHKVELQGTQNDVKKVKMILENLTPK